MSPRDVIIGIALLGVKLDQRNAGSPIQKVGTSGFHAELVNGVFAGLTLHLERNPMDKTAGIDLAYILAFHKLNRSFRSVKNPEKIT